MAKNQKPLCVLCGDELSHVSIMYLIEHGYRCVHCRKEPRWNPRGAKGIKGGKWMMLLLGLAVLAWLILVALIVLDK